MKTKFVCTIISIALTCIVGIANAQSPTPSSPKKPNILVIMGDDIGWFNPSCYNSGVMGYRTPNIDRIAKEGMIFTDYYAEQSCTAGRSSFITGQCTLRTGLSKVGVPGSSIGLQDRDVTMARFSEGQRGSERHVGFAVRHGRTRRPTIRTASFQTWREL
jgi:hypothetical protein